MDGSGNTGGDKYISLMEEVLLNHLLSQWQTIYYLSISPTIKVTEWVYLKSHPIQNFQNLQMLWKYRDLFYIPTTTWKLLQLLLYGWIQSSIQKAYYEDEASLELWQKAFADTRKI